MEYLQYGRHQVYRHHVRMTIDMYAKCVLCISKNLARLDSIVVQDIENSRMISLFYNQNEIIFFLHATVIWATTTFRRLPNNILPRVFNITGFAMNAILRINL